MAQNVKTIQGLAIASCKTVQGLAIASAKTILGVDNTSGGATYTLQETFGADTNQFDFANTGIRTYISSEILAGSSYTITQVEVRILRVGAGSAPDLVCEIRADTGSQPDTPPLATSTNTIVSADVGTSMQWVAFQFAGLAVTNATRYYLGLKASSVDASNYYTARGGAISSGDVQSSLAGTTSWSGLSSRQWWQRTYVSP